MSTLYKTSSATLVRGASNRIILIIDYMNPEIVWPQLLREYFLEVDYASLYPNFSTLRISAVHPFAVLLFQDVSGQKLDTSVFPSITITDSTENEVFTTMGRGYAPFMLDGSNIVLLQAGKESGQMIISDTSLSRLQTAVADGGKVYGRKRSVHMKHTIDLSVWCDNKELTGILYDLLRQFALQTEKLHNLGFDIQDQISGRRSGDINVEFGKLLYGANISIPVIIETTMMEFDVSIDAIVNINANGIYTNP